jgi:hypothetical protein
MGEVEAVRARAVELDRIGVFVVAQTEIILVVEEG